MNILFVHGNYPAQFDKLSRAIASSEENNVVYLTEAKIESKQQANNITIKNYRIDRKGSENIHHYLTTTEECILRGQAVIRGVNELRDEGFIPNIVIFHGGMGLGLFLRDMLPNAILIGYFEWWFDRINTKYLVKEYSFDDQLSAGIRNLTTLKEIELCTVGVVPTEWQKTQFPKLVLKKLRVIFDGIDTSFFRKNMNSITRNILIRNRETKEKFKIEEEDTVLTYATRGMEPLRGFPEFMRALPGALKRFERLKVYIAGADRCAYSFRAPNTSGSWKKYMMDEIANVVSTKNIYFTGLLNYEDYRKLLWRSDLHCYFTKPYVTSWSLFEATSCGTKILTNYGEATSDIAKEGTYRRVDIFNQKDVSRGVIEGINDSIKGRYPKSETAKDIDVQKSLQEWKELLQECLDQVI